ncbi:RNA polymerase III [Aureococcus anophagefferens]|uniref:RNA polymerase III n=1 Tax=Aureococcus anophagefferens TaxID=44056 RepID=A0ABR1FZY5_AURAN
MQQQTLNKALKVLESRKLVKTVKSVQQNEKLYMAYDLVPTREVSGGPWYTDQEFDHEFVGAIKKIVVKYVQSLEEFTAVTAASKASRYKIAKPAVDVAWVGEVPAGCVPEAPGRRYCADGRHAPASCQYLQKWLEQDDDDELECTGVRRS